MKIRKDKRYRKKVTLPSGEVKYVYGRSQKEAKKKVDDLKLQYAMGATNLDKMGLNDKSCQYLLGHAEISTTKNIYTHFQDEHLEIAAKKLENLYEFSTQGVRRGSN